ncbi:MAG: dihydropteroate synthase [Candidatus Delongbacteria bacterium]|nr:dihydropteroate synthase [Candidatus Delongbacteria bacterium]
MGIINVTPDSFYSGGGYHGLQEVVDRAGEMVEAGAHLLDIGGESSRPGALPVSVAEELDRVVPIIEALGRSLPVPLSVDTRKSEVARAALVAGASIVNDISALRDDPDMAAVVARAGADLILMHMQGSPHDMQNNPHYDDVLQEVADFLHTRVETAAAAGIDKSSITTDPGIGFGKRLEDNLALLANPEACRVNGCPVLIGASRKSFINLIQPDTLPDQRLAGTLAAHLFSVAAGGCDLLRVHDVAETIQALSVWRALEKYTGCGQSTGMLNDCS